ncbi:MAG: PEP/pyruvate-binding domain-containing protein [Spirochaetales bacterium]|nr:PEP/pyruvate-binding domain-containing protein [Spirochaetales bacterium]MCF7939435.1 PEP/pyruvate-binding domain-containing protein [Spirochaetales bacterium]
MDTNGTDTNSTDTSGMDIEKHLLYQHLFREEVNIQDFIKTFQAILERDGLLDSLELESRAPCLAREFEDEENCEKYHNAYVIKTIFENYEREDILDYINLAQKEKLARKIWNHLQNENYNSEEVKRLLSDFSRLPIGRSQLSENLAIGIRVNLINDFINNNLHFVGIAKNYITMRDINDIIKRIIGASNSRGKIGGKSAGMLLANRVLMPAIQRRPEYEEFMKETTSYFIDSRIFSVFIEHNSLEEVHSLKYLDHDDIDKQQEVLYASFLRATFPQWVMTKFRTLLRELNDTPLIIRSSSLLEDNFGAPFYGKYDSFFIANQGSEDERLDELVETIKKVYYSIFRTSVIAYRRDKNLLDFKEIMCILVQKVVGKQYGKYWFPAFAGVAFSRNIYTWNEKIREEEGMLRLVMGLGTRAVDRVGDDYPRIVSLSAPLLRPEGSFEDQFKYSQRYVDVLNLENRSIESVHFVDLINEIRDTIDPHADFSYAVSQIEDEQFVNPLLVPGRYEYGSAAITFDTLLRDKKFCRRMIALLNELETVYKTPVDIEFAYQDEKFYLLQCRPLFQNSTYFQKEVSIPRNLPEEDILFTVRRGFSGNVIVEDIRYMIYVDADGYASLSTEHEKLHIARLVGLFNRKLKNEKFILMGPGRWGSNNINLGVKVSYGDINNSRMIIEVAKKTADYVPEVSYGTHFFQDLVEADIIYLPVYPDDEEVIYQEDFLKSAPTAADDFLDTGRYKQEVAPYDHVVKLIDFRNAGAERLLQMYLDADNKHGVAFLQ